MDELTKYRITGAIVWLTLLIMLVPSWYANPVDYEKAQPWLHSNSTERLNDIAITSNMAKQVDGVTSVSSEADHDTDVSQLPDIPRDTEKPNRTLEERPAPIEPTTQPIESERLNQESVKPERVEEAPETTEPIMASEDKSPAWLVRVASYNSIESANRTLGVLEMRYKVTIGDFSTKTQKIYSVRVGPFYSLAEAEQAKTELDKELVTNSVIVQIR